MNAIKRLYCRAYQLAFRAALPVLPYRQPRLLDHLAEIAPLLEQKQISSVLLVADAGVRSLGLTSGLENSLAAAHIACVWRIPDVCRQDVPLGAEQNRPRRVNHGNLSSCL